MGCAAVTESNKKPQRIEHDGTPTPVGWSNGNAMGWTKTHGKKHKDELPPLTEETLLMYFPGAMEGKVAELHVASHLMKHGYNAENTLFADSSCPDEINHDDPGEDITSLF